MSTLRLASFWCRKIGLSGLLPCILLCAGAGLSGRKAHALGEHKLVSFEPVPGGFVLAEGKLRAPLVVDASEYPGVVRAAHDLQEDIARAAGAGTAVELDDKRLKGSLMIVGTLGHNARIDALVRSGKLDVSAIAGKWEATLIAVVEHPFAGVPRALVIVGSDKRGTIFGVYDVSEQIGVSPWYWWADVPVRHHDALYVMPGKVVHGEPAVKYRGIFLNDEAPALSGWTKEKFGGYNHLFYEKVFELLLRLRANYLWPAMWASAFNEDDPENARLADEYGIVMGTSHHEPMLRAQQEWKRHGNGIWDYATNAEVLKKFWGEGIERNKNFESTLTLGMRGDGDMPMTEGANIALLEKIVADQRAILAEHATPTLNADPKVWALYKEVQAYYEKGMRVADDVTLLWCDDNWGNIRRLPTAEERKRAGGAGIYYHFDYVGDPRNYKWLNTNPIAKVWEQMHLALDYGADRIWIVNVGDLKPMEFPIEYFLSFARDPERWGKDATEEFTRQWAEREFGAEHAAEIANLVTTYTRYNGRRKPELIDAETFSLTNYGEADRVFAEWKSLTEEAESIGKLLPADEQDAYFELVLHPIEASATVTELYITAGRNRLFAKEGRASANELAEEARALFRQDAAITDRYNHQLAGGKWNHMMDQTHLGYTYWQEPPLNVMPAVSEVQPLAEGAENRMGVAVEGSEGVEALRFDNVNRQSRSVEVFNRGVAPFDFTAKASEPWIMLSTEKASVDKDVRLMVSVDWNKAPVSSGQGTITLTQAGGQEVTVAVTAERVALPAGFAGFVEGDGFLSMEAEHFTKHIAAGDVSWERIPDYGATVSGLTVTPSTAASVIGTGARLDYAMYLTGSGAMQVEATLGPTLGFVPGRGLRYAVWFDDGVPVIVDAMEHNSDRDWARVVSDSVRRVETTLTVAGPGVHTLHFAMVDSGVVLERLVVSDGPLRASYLGPPESMRVP